MARPDGRWVPDGRAGTLRSDCEASLEALDGLPIDLFLVHAPDPRTPWATTVRALAKLVDDGLVKRVGIANVNRRQLDEALELAPIAAVQVAVSVYDDHAIRGGVVARCEERGLTVIAHSPLGGPRRIARLRRDETLRRTAPRRNRLRRASDLLLRSSRSRARAPSRQPGQERVPRRSTSTRRPSPAAGEPGATHDRTATSFSSWAFPAPASRAQPNALSRRATVG